jgi:hypothetical protein
LPKIKVGDIGRGFLRGPKRPAAGIFSLRILFTFAFLFSMKDLTEGNEARLIFKFFDTYAAWKSFPAVI